MSEQPQTVLILDDDDDVRRSLVEFFEDREWRVLWAATLEDALEVLESESPDGVVVDIRLPGMDGNGFIRSVSKTYPDLSYLICTGFPRSGPTNRSAAPRVVPPRRLSRRPGDLRPAKQSREPRPVSRRPDRIGRICA